MAFSLYLVQVVLLKRVENAIYDTFYVRRKSIGVCYRVAVFTWKCSQNQKKKKKIVILVESHTTFT